MKLAQTVVYGLKGATRSGIGYRLNRTAKYAAGLYFDLFVRTYRSEGMVFTIPAAYTSREMRGKFTVDTYEYPERTLIKRYLPHNACVLELGACIGVVSCVINSLLDNRDLHVAVEANPLLMPTLEANRMANGARFHAVNAVVTRQPSAMISTDAVMDSNQVGASGTPVPTTTVEALEAVAGEAFSALIMDIEGGEYEFCRENPMLLRQIDVAIIEFHPLAFGEARLGELYLMLASAGLERRETILTVECWLRVED